MSDIPAGWRSVQLKDAGTWLSGGTPYTEESRYWGGEIPWISAASLKDFRISQSDRRVTEQGASAGTRRVPLGTVVFVVRGMSLKTEFRVGVTAREVAFGQDCKAILPASGIDGKFLGLALKARESQILEMVDEAGHGTGRLPTDLISKLSIGMPPYGEQRRIVEIIDALDLQIASSIGSIAKLELVRSGAILEAMQVGRSAVVPLRSFLLDIEAGRSPDLEDAPAGFGQWGVLKVSAVGDGVFRPEENKVVRDRSLCDFSICVRPGDLLITRANTPQLVGRSCIVQDCPQGLMLCDKTLRLVVDERSVPVRYIHIALGLTETRRQIENAATGSSGSMKNISQQSIKQLLIPSSSPEGIRRVVELDALYENQISAMRREVDRLRLFKQGLMNDLLTGQVRVTSASQ